MKIGVAFDNLSTFFDDDDNDDDQVRADIPAEAFRDESGKIVEIRIYNPKYEEIITIDRRKNIEALSVDEFYK